MFLLGCEQVAPDKTLLLKGKLKSVENRINSNETITEDYSYSINNFLLLNIRRSYLPQNYFEQYYIKRTDVSNSVEEVIQHTASNNIKVSDYVRYYFYSPKNVLVQVKELSLSNPEESKVEEYTYNDTNKLVQVTTSLANKSNTTTKIFTWKDDNVVKIEEYSSTGIKEKYYSYDENSNPQHLLFQNDSFLPLDLSAKYMSKNIIKEIYEKTEDVRLRYIHTYNGIGLLIKSERQIAIEGTWKYDGEIKYIYY
jgi:hypothetical protein